MKLIKIPLLPIVLALLFLASCHREEKAYEIGFIGGLSGGNADLGEAGRNGAIMAVEEANRGGGIQGQAVRLVIKDDGNSLPMARKAAEELRDRNVEAVIGPFSTTLTEEVISVMNPAEKVVITPTASAIQLSGIDDYLFKMNASTRDNAMDYARFIGETRGWKSVSLVADSQNKSFSDSWFGEFEKFYLPRGGRIVTMAYLNSREETDYDGLVENLLREKPDCVLFIANSVDSARLAQQLRKLDRDTPMLTVEWAGTQQLIELGGAAVEGMFVLQNVDFFSREENFLRFLDDYQIRFGRYPSFSSILAYDAVIAVIGAMNRKGKDMTLKEALISFSPYPGLQQPIVFDHFGDGKRNSTFVVIRDRHYETAH